MELSKNKKILWYIFLFILFVFWGLIFQNLNWDETWNYGFAHSIYKGLIPYKDFNMVITPFFSFLMSLPFNIFGSSILVFYIENGFILLGLYYLLEKLIKDKALICITIIFYIYHLIIPSYNMFLLFLYVLLVFLEKRNSYDYLIGLIIGISILTKQTVGIFMILPSIMYLKKDYKKIIKRLFGLLIPIIIFIVYLLFSNSLSEFINLCFLGLLDFYNDNNAGFSVFFIVFIAFISIIIYFIKKDKTNISNYYTLAFMSIMIPLFDLYHTFIAFIGILLMIFLNKEFKVKYNLYIFFVLLMLGLSITSIIRIDFNFKYPNNINRFEYKAIDKDMQTHTKAVLKYLDSCDKANQKVMIISGQSYYFKLIRDIPIDYYDLLNGGNWGYKGSEKLMKDVTSRKNTLFLIDEAEYSKYSQTDKNLMKYIMKNGKKINEVGMFSIYSLE